MTVTCPSCKHPTNGSVSKCSWCKEPLAKRPPRTTEIKRRRRRGQARPTEVVIEGLTPHHGESVGECPCDVCDVLYYWNHTQEERKA